MKIIYKIDKYKILFTLFIASILFAGACSSDKDKKPE
jgi:hypothetical protein